MLENASSGGLPRCSRMKCSGISRPDVDCLEPNRNDFPSMPVGKPSER